MAITMVRSRVKIINHVSELQTDLDHDDAGVDVAAADVVVDAVAAAAAAAPAS